MAAAAKTQDERDPIELAVLLIRAQQKKLVRLQGKLSARQMRIVRTALADIQARLLAFEGGVWNEARFRATMQMLAEGIATMTGTAIAQVTRDLGLVSMESQAATARFLATMDRQFVGAALRPLRFDTLAWWEENYDNIGRVRIRQYPNSFRRYGATVTSKIEQSIGKTVLVGEPWYKARDEVWALTRDIVQGRQWMVDRIVRTESSGVWNSTSLAAMAEEDEEDDPMFKKLVAHFDDATGRDSVMLHGQTRPHDKPFYDAVNGITYMAPPNRPHDREIVVPWRKSYEDEFGDFTSETATDYDPKLHGKRKRLESTKRPPSGELPRKPRRRPDPTRPSPRTRVDQLKMLRGQRRDLTEDLRKTRGRISGLEADIRARGTAAPGGMRDALRTQTELRTSLRKQLEEYGTWIDQVGRM